MAGWRWLGRVGGNCLLPYCVIRMPNAMRSCSLRMPNCSLVGVSTSSYDVFLSGGMLLSAVNRKHNDHRYMKSILKATAILSSGSLVSILVGLVSAKFSALLLGPSGVGYMGLLQSTLSLVVLVAGMGGISAGLVRAGARARAEENIRQEAALRSGAWMLCWCLGGLAVVLIFVLRGPLSRVMLGG